MTNIVDLDVSFTGLAGQVDNDIDEFPSNASDIPLVVGSQNLNLGPTNTSNTATSHNPPIHA